MNTDTTPMRRTLFEHALQRALAGELLTDTGAWEALQVLLQQIAVTTDHADRTVLVAAARDAYLVGEPAQG